jgi:hypothetical protein
MQDTCKNIKYVLWVYSQLWSFHTSAYLSGKTGTFPLDEEKSDVDGQDAAAATPYRPVKRKA